PGMTHSYRTHGLLATAWGHLFSHSYGLFEAQMPSEKIRWIRSLRGAECELEHSKPSRKLFIGVCARTTSHSRLWLSLGTLPSFPLVFSSPKLSRNSLCSGIPFPS